MQGRLTAVDKRRSCTTQVDDLLAVGAVFYLVDTAGAAGLTIFTCEKTDLTYRWKLVPFCCAKPLSRDHQNYAHVFNLSGVIRVR
jgi:hypothetical protein